MLSELLSTNGDCTFALINTYVYMYIYDYDILGSNRTFCPQR